MFFVVPFPRKTVGPSLNKSGGHKREAGIVTTGISLGCFDYFGNYIGLTLRALDKPPSHHAIWGIGGGFIIKLLRVNCCAMSRYLP